MIKLRLDYSKKLGLPGYSSHQFSISLETEITDVSQVHAESARIYKLLQEGVDREIQKTGWLPGEVVPVRNGIHQSRNGNGHHPVSETDEWKCSPAQKELILKITQEHKLDKATVEKLAQDRFGKGVKQLNKLEASGLIEELLEQTGQTKPRNQRFQKVGNR